MGCYINSRHLTKEAWLKQNAVMTAGPTPISETMIPICLVDNGPFTAAAVCFNDGELQAFQRPDGRPKIWFTAPRELVRQVSDLENWEKERGRIR